MKPADPIFHVRTLNEGYAERGWYFWDETWANYYGPWPTKKQAKEALAEYCRVVLGAPIIHGRAPL